MKTDIQLFLKQTLKAHLFQIIDHPKKEKGKKKIYHLILQNENQGFMKRTLNKKFVKQR